MFLNPPAFLAISLLLTLDSLPVIETHVGMPPKPISSQGSQNMRAAPDDKKAKRRRQSRSSLVPKKSRNASRPKDVADHMTDKAKRKARRHETYMRYIHKVRWPASSLTVFLLAGVQPGAS